jgi:hypothetical protein
MFYTLFRPLPSFTPSLDSEQIMADEDFMDTSDSSRENLLINTDQHIERKGGTFSRTV